MLDQTAANAIAQAVATLLGHKPHPVTEEALATVAITYEPRITCPVCHMTSYNLNDIKERYCGQCHQFHSDMR